MKLKRPEARPPTETIIALIDVIFFLLIFFMLVGRMDATAPFQVLPPVAGVGAPMPKGGTTVSLSADGQLALDGVEFDRAEVISRVAEAPGAMVRVNADAAAELRRLLPLIAQLEDLPGKEVVLVVTPEPL
ncbi:MAG: biopolymer transporter ExbD [Pseudomonadota bacterium]